MTEPITVPLIGFPEPPWRGATALRPGHPVDDVKGYDAFMAGGYRNLVLKMFELNLRDILSKDPVLAQEARDWFDPVAGRNAAISFEDCIYVMGWASVLEEARSLALNDPQKMLVQFHSALQSIYREGLTQGPRETEETAASPAAKRIDADTLSGIHRGVFGHA
jgi:hypothetical protein